jgi:hypothetical protein
MNQLEVVLTVSGSDYFLSDSAHIGQDGNFYQEWIVEPPQLKLGPVRGGYVAPQIGGMKIANDLIDANHPFSGSRFTTVLATPGPYVMKLYHGMKYPIFQGTVTLSGITERFMDFQIEATQITTEILSYQDEISTTVGTGSVTNTVPIAFTHGVVRDQGPVFVKELQGSPARWVFWNPGFNTTVSDTKAILINFGDIGVDTVDSSVIKTGFPTLGTQVLAGSGAFNIRAKILFSGTGVNGTSIKDFFDYAATTYVGSSGCDVSKSSTAASRDIHLFQSEQISFIDLGAQVAESTNHLFQVRPNQTDGSLTVYLIDRAYSATATTLVDSEVVATQSKFDPFNKVSGTYNVTRFKGETTYGTSGGVNYYGAAQEMETVPVECTSINLGFGKTKKVNIYADTFNQSDGASSEVQVLLDAIRDVEKKPRASITIDGVQSSYEIGDRFVYNSREDFIKYDLFTESIEWDFSNRQTTVSGHATLTPYEQA